MLSLKGANLHIIILLLKLFAQQKNSKLFVVSFLLLVELSIFLVVSSFFETILKRDGINTVKIYPSMRPKRLIETCFLGLG